MTERLASRLRIYSKKLYFNIFHLFWRDSKKGVQNVQTEPQTQCFSVFGACPKAYSGTSSGEVCAEQPAINSLKFVVRQIFTYIVINYKHFLFSVIHAGCGRCVFLQSFGIVYTFLYITALILMTSIV